jgi:hypothetical protein
MLEFIAAVMDAGGHVPMIGDADDAVMVRFSREPEFCPYRSLLATGAVLFGRNDFRTQAGRFDDKSRWLLRRVGTTYLGRSLGHRKRSRESWTAVRLVIQESRLMATRTPLPFCFRSVANPY